MRATSTMLAAAREVKNLGDKGFLFAFHKRILSRFLCEAFGSLGTAITIICFRNSSFVI